MSNMLLKQATRERPQAFCHFSNHAFDRLAQRSALFYHQVADLLDQGLVVNTGCKPGFNRAHLVFYSSIDDCCFVAIQDIVTGTVVTILPLDYHANLAWSIDEETQNKAKEKALSLKKVSECKNQPPQSYLIYAHYVNEEGKYKSVKLTSYKAADYEHEFTKFINSAPWEKELEALLLNKNIHADSLSDLTAREGNRGCPFLLST